MENVIRVIVKRGMGYVPVSGQWVNGAGPTEYTLVKGKHYPPAKRGTIWTLVDTTKHKKKGG